MKPFSKSVIMTGQSNGPFNEIVGVCNKFIGELSPSSNSPEAISTDSLTESVVQTDVESRGPE